MTDKELLKDILELIQGVRAGIQYAERYIVQDYASIAEIMSFFNGYADSPNIDEIERRIKEELNET